MGVGFSYTTDFNYTIGDVQVAAENYAALVDFYRIFPLFRVVDLYITGESYAGIYIPMLAAKIVESQSANAMNLKGIAIGNGLLSKAIDTDTLMEFSYQHGIIDEK